MYNHEEIDVVQKRIVPQFVREEPTFTIKLSDPEAGTPQTSYEATRRSDT